MQMREQEGCYLSWALHVVVSSRADGVSCWGETLDGETKGESCVCVSPKGSCPSNNSFEYKTWLWKFNNFYFLNFLFYFDN